MTLVQTYKTTNGYVSELSRTAPPLEGWEAFQSPLDAGNCMAITDQLEVDFTEQKARYLTPNPAGQTPDDPGAPPNPAVVLVDADSAAAWESGATVDAINAYRYSLWVYEQLQGSNRPEIKAALGL